MAFLFPGGGASLNETAQFRLQQPLQQYDPATAAAIANAERKRRIANLLMQQGLAPGPNVTQAGRFVVPRHPLERVADLAKAAVGAYAHTQSDKQVQEAIGGEVEANREAQHRVLRALAAPQDVPERTLPQGRPPMPTQGPPDIRQDIDPLTGQMGPIREIPPAPSPAVPPTQGPVNPAIPAGGDTREARLRRVQEAVLGLSPRLMQRYMPAVQMAQREADLEATRQFQSEEKAADREVRREGIEANAATRLLQLENNMTMKQMMIDERMRRGQEVDDLKRDLQRDRERHDALMKEQDRNTRMAMKEMDIDEKVAKREEKRHDKREEARASMNMIGTSIQQTRDVLKQLREHKGLKRITGLMGSVPNWPGGDAADAQATLDRLKSRASVDMLNQMRSMSKTGGGVGQVTEREWGFLSDAAARLQQSQSYEQFVAALDEFDAALERAEANVTNAFNRQFPAGEGEETLRAVQPPSQPETPVGTVAPFEDPGKERRYQEWKKQHTGEGEEALRAVQPPSQPEAPVGAAAPFDDPEKERRYQEWKKQHK